MTNTNPTARRLTISEVQTKSYERHTANGETGKECIRCGRQTAEEMFIEIDTGCGESQGFFPVGPECLKVLKKLGAIVLSASETAQ